MPFIHPKTWGDGVMPLDEFDPEHRTSILEAVDAPEPPPRFLKAVGGWIVSRAWREWHWARGKKLVYVPGPGRRRIPVDVRRAVLERDGLTCGICGLDVEPNDIHLDHIFPHSLGGSDRLDNLQVSHSRCNRAKGARI
jgi:hypothetical protein